MYSKIFDKIINKPYKEQFYVGTVVSATPTYVKLTPDDDPIPYIKSKSLVGVEGGSRILLLKYINKFIGICVIGDNETYLTQSDLDDYATLDDLDDYVATADVAWTSWTPTLNWTGTTPSGLTTKAKYCIVGDMCHFVVDITTTDGNGATNLTIDAPANEASDNIHTLFSAVQIVNGVYNYNVPCWINNALGTHKIEFRNLSTFTNGVTSYLFLSGFYELA